jgi:Na+/melibiose symporter-like transporter
MVEQKNYLSDKEKRMYYFGAAGQGGLYAIVNTFYGLFCAFILFRGKPDMLYALGWWTLGATLWDSISDPIMGVIVDKTRTKSGKMIPYIKIAPILVLGFQLLLFTRPSLEDGALLVFCVAMYTTWFTAYTVGDVPFWGLPIAMTPNHKERTELLSKARLYNALGVVLPYALYLFVPGDSSGLYGGGNRHYAYLLRSIPAYSLLHQGAL